MKPKRRMCILTDGFLDVFTAKTAMGLLRYCPDEVVAVLDREHAGENLEDLVGVGRGVPLVDGIDAAQPYAPNQLVLGVALPGGRLPDSWRQTICEALASGMDVVNGLHTRLKADPELSARAAELGREIWDVRTPPKVANVGAGRARQTRGKRILTIGTDCNLGKRVTALELVREMRNRGIEAEYVATGQTGVMISGSGVVADAVTSDFVSGAVEAAVLTKADADFIVIEGQGALVHPGYSAVTLGLMHGALPDYMVLCHAPSRTNMRNSDVPVMKPAEMVTLSEAVLRPLWPAEVIGVSLNCHGMNCEEAAHARLQVQDETGLPVVDSLRTGVGELVDVLQESVR